MISYLGHVDGGEVLCALVDDANAKASNGASEQELNGALVRDKSLETLSVHHIYL